MLKDPFLCTVKVAKLLEPSPQTADHFVIIFLNSNLSNKKNTNWLIQQKQSVRKMK